MIAQNIAHQALLRGLTVRFVNAKAMFTDLGALPTTGQRDSRLRHYISPQLLIIDEFAHFGPDPRQTDALYDVVAARYQNKSTVVVSQRHFDQWPEVFPNATCTRMIMDRFTHYADIVDIVGKSYRWHEAQLRA